VGRSAEVVDMLSIRKVDVAGLQEVRYKNVGMKIVKGGNASNEVIQISGLESVLARIGNSMMYGDRMQKSWRRSVLISLYKGKDYAKECSNYRSLKMLEHAINIMEKVRRIQHAVTISDIQMGFMLLKSTVDAIFAVRQLVEKTVGNDSFIAFIDLKNL